MEDEDPIIDQPEGAAFARGQLDALDAALTRLSSKREAIANYITAIWGDPVPPSPVLLKAGAASSQTAAELDEPEKRAYPSRQFNKRIVGAALEIINREGRPMTAPEIHLEHPERTKIGTEALYRLIYNRVISKELYSFAGAFWPMNRPIPEGFDISMSKRLARKAAKSSQRKPSAKAS